MKREPPEIRWRAVVAGGAATFLLAISVSLVAAVAGSPILLAAAVWLAIAVGGAAAGRLARAAGALHGGLVAVLWIVADMLAGTAGPQTGDVITDTVRTVAFDASWLAVGALAGWLGSRSAGGD